MVSRGAARRILTSIMAHGARTRSTWPKRVGPVRFQPGQAFCSEDRRYGVTIP